jgi:hypothetical protein
MIENRIKWKLSLANFGYHNILEDWLGCPQDVGSSLRLQSPFPLPPTTEVVTTSKGETCE